MTASQERWGLLFIASLILALDIAMFGSLGLQAWCLIPPVLVLAIVFIGPRPGITVWRDALCLLCFGVFFVRAFAPHEWPKPVRWSLGACGTSAIPLLFVAYSYGGGLGIPLRRIARSDFGRGLEVAFRRLTDLGTLAVCLAILAYGFSDPKADRTFLLVPALLVLAALLPRRWSAIDQAAHMVGCLPLPILGLGGLLGWWKMGYFWLFLISTFAAHSIGKLRDPLETNAERNETALLVG